MNSRETMFSANLIDKSMPDRHYKKKSVHDISKTTGIDHRKGQESPVRRQKSTAGHRTSTASTYNPITGQNVDFVAYRRCQQAGPKFAGQSYEINPTGITESKKHVIKPDNIKANKVTTVDFSVLKYRDQDKQARVGTYMNSSQMKGIFSVEEDRYYRGLVSRK